MKNVKNRSAFPDWFIDELVHEEDKQKARNNELKLSDRVDFVCPYHGVYNQEIRIHIKKSTGEKIGGCRTCSQSYKRHYQQWFIDMLANESDKERARNNALLSTDRVDFICQKHGIFNTRVDYITCNGKRTSHGCPACGKERQLQNYSETMQDKRPEYPQWFIDDLALEEDKKRAIDRTLKKTDEVLFVCKTHGKYKQLVANHLNFGQRDSHGCELCANDLLSDKIKEARFKKRDEYPQWLIDELAFDEDKEKLKQKLLTTSDSVAFICKTHGVYHQIIGNHFQYSTKERRCGCPKCSVKKSSYEDELFEIIHSLDENAEQRNRNTIKEENSKRFMELDIYCPDKRIAFEFNGNYWHSEEQKPNNYHLKKFKLCEQQNIRLISIFEKDWFEKKEKIINFIKNIFCEQKRIFARQTKIKIIPNNNAKLFCDKYHMNGFGNNITESFGLFFDNELISVMCFSKPRFLKTKKYDWELNRFCSKTGIYVIGGASKLLSFFIKKEKPTTIITYSDCNYFTGKVYEQLGFTFSGFTSIPYYWFNNKTFIQREQCQPKLLKDKHPELYQEALKEQPDSIETFIMSNLGFSRVYTAGNKKWIFHDKEKQ